MIMRFLLPSKLITRHALLVACYALHNFSHTKTLPLLFQGSQAATKINRNVRKVNFSLITQIIAEKE